MGFLYFGNTGWGDELFIAMLMTIAVAVAAILTPPDPVTQIGLAIPLLLLYELSILTVKFTEKKDKEVEDA